ncbi:MAG TPA: 16S rRNA (cytosine(967)-C(5))-methyltransferase RsmB [Dissulfurispiraceae bacterium]|nr:16S rRNA (cytosine(967)-C(5))-methyltransferase RsmB [Dissulfurispiraceae bacterium]
MKNCKTSIRSLAVGALTRILPFDNKEAVKPKDALESISVGLDERDRSFVMEIVYGVTRYRDYLDWMLGRFLDKPSSLHSYTINNLRTAVYQLCFMRVPEWAAVSEAVDIEKTQGRKGRAGLVNAVLRSFLRQRNYIGQPDSTDALNYISLTTSHPAWLIRRWIERLGPDNARRLACANNEIPPLTLRIIGDREMALQELLDRGVAARKTLFSPAGIILKDIAPGKIPLDRATYMIQDEAAQLITYLLEPLVGDRVLDACAAPGGKTTHMASLMKDRGEVVAVEIDPTRIAKLTENISRLRLRSIKVIRADIRKAAIRGLFDKILVDAPCSSTGVIRRNPDVKYRHDDQALARFGAIQGSLLKSAASLLKPGGVMVYSVCSTEPEEGEAVIKSFLQSNTNFSIIQEACPLIEGFACFNGSGHLYYRTWPYADTPGYAMDGFFAVKLKRNR